MRDLRAQHGISQKKLATDLMVSAAYLSALEHGHRGRPSDGLIHQICAYFDIIWDEAEDLKRLAALSHPRVVIDTAGLDPVHTRLANALALRIGALPEATARALLARIEGTDEDE